MNKRAMMLAVGIAMTAGIGLAGVVFTSETSDTLKDGKNQKVVSKGYAQDAAIRVEFIEGNQGSVPPGNYLLSKGDSIVYFVNPEEKTYVAMNLDQMGAYLGMAQQFVKIKFEDYKTETLVDEKGPKMLGHRTRHYKYKTSYKMTARVFGIRSASTVERMEDIWSATDIQVEGADVWRKQAQRLTGSEEFDKLIEAEQAKIKGFPIKQESTMTTTDKKGRSETTSTLLLVTALETKNLEEALFELPVDYTGTGMTDMITGEMPDLSEMNADEPEPEPVDVGGMAKDAALEEAKSRIPFSGLFRKKK